MENSTNFCLHLICMKNIYFAVRRDLDLRASYVYLCVLGLSLLRGRLFISVVANFLQVCDYGQILKAVYICNPQCVVLGEAQGKKILLFCFARPLCSYMPFL